ncbi:MAG: hypothetical protein Q9164_000431 [Protoblastenia rupestris]
MTSDRIAKENLRRRFQQNQEDCTITVLELLPTVTEDILEALPSEKISEELQQRKAERLGKSVGTSEIAPSEVSSGTPSAKDEDSRSFSSFQSESYVHASQVAASTSSGGGQRPQSTKVQLWNDLKISSITRALTLLYTVSLLSLLTRIQLNLLGRRNYLSSVIAQASYAPPSPTISLENRDDDGAEGSYGNDFETNRKYLTFSWWLLHRGWRGVMTKVEEAVKEVFGPLKPTEDVALEKMSALILDVRRRVEGSTAEERSAREWLHNLLPSQEEEECVLRESGMSNSIPSPQTLPLLSTGSSSPPLRRLLDETSDLIDSPMFTHVLTLILDSTFSQLIDQKLRSEAYRLLPLDAGPAGRIQDVTDNDPTTASAKLATIMAVMTKEAHKIGNGVPNMYVQALESVSDLEAFAAVIYSSNLELEASVKIMTPPMPTQSITEPDAEAEKSIIPEAGIGLIDKAAGGANATWSGFRSVWGKVTGKGDEQMTG